MSLQDKQLITAARLTSPSPLLCRVIAEASLRCGCGDKIKTAYGPLCEGLLAWRISTNGFGWMTNNLFLSVSHWALGVFCFLQHNLIFLNITGQDKTKFRRKSGLFALSLLWEHCSKENHIHDSEYCLVYAVCGCYTDIGIPRWWGQKLVPSHCYISPSRGNVEPFNAGKYCWKQFLLPKSENGACMHTHTHIVCICSVLLRTESVWMLSIYLHTYIWRGKGRERQIKGTTFCSWSSAKFQNTE